MGKCVSEKLGIAWEGFNSQIAEKLKDVIFSPNVRLVFPDDVKVARIICEDSNGDTYETVLIIHNDGKGWNVIKNNEPMNKAF